MAKLADIVYKTESAHLQVLAGSAGFLYPALVVGPYSRKRLLETYTVFYNQTWTP